MEFAEAAGGKRNIRALVVDDDTTIRTIHCRLLQNLGIQDLDEAINGKEAIDIHCSGRNFHLILMDLEMPIINGIEATKQLRAMGVRSTIAGVSTWSSEQRVQEFMQAGLDDYQAKPLTSAKLISILNKINTK